MYQATQKYKRLFRVFPAMTVTKIGKYKNDIKVFIGKQKEMIDQREDKNHIEHKKYIADLLENDQVQEMRSFLHHAHSTCYDHCFNVSYYGYLVCRFFGLDYVSAARGGMLHDLFLYDWKTTKTPGNLHAFTHPKSALTNADLSFDLNKIERDVILKHMWPLTMTPPKYKESLIISLIDKYVTLKEVILS
jgi:uncharacterized protein